MGIHTPADLCALCGESLTALAPAQRHHLKGAAVVLVLAALLAQMMNDAPEKLDGLQVIVYANIFVGAVRVRA